jgi:cystathionine beta-lyase
LADIVAKVFGVRASNIDSRALWLIVTNEKYWLGGAVVAYGFCMSPDDCYLALRALRRIGVRMRHQQQSVLKDCSGATCGDPALENDPGYALWRRDFSGAASCLA